MKRPDHRLELGYGSAWHLLRCLGWHRREFSNELAKAIRVGDIEWLDFGLGGSGRYPTTTPIRDSELVRLNFLPEEVQKLYDHFWPGASRQSWDAVGRADGEWLLVEAKGHLGEVQKKRTPPKGKPAKQKITQAFQATLKALGHSEDDAAALSEVWIGNYYQTGNRLATLHFLLSKKIPARLVFLYFCGDKHPKGTAVCPREPAGWNATRADIKKTLGLTGKSEIETRVHEVYMDIKTLKGGVIS